MFFHSQFTTLTKPLNMKCAAIWGWVPESHHSHHSSDLTMWMMVMDNHPHPWPIRNHKISHEFPTYSPSKSCMFQHVPTCFLIWICMKLSTHLRFPVPFSHGFAYNSHQIKDKNPCRMGPLSNSVQLRYGGGWLLWFNKVDITNQPMDISGCWWTSETNLSILNHS